jgi:xanthine dehydrogenase accessory factor
MSFVFIRGGGDLASGVALRLHRAGMPVIIAELPEPLAVRRRVSFATAVYDGSVHVEDCQARRVDDPIDNSLIEQIFAERQIPVLVDPDGDYLKILKPKVVVDARMLKQNIKRHAGPEQMLIGLGPGFVAGDNCDAVIETNRGNSMGRVIWIGATERNTGSPATVAGHNDARVLRSPVNGVVETYADIGDRVIPGQSIAQVNGHFINAPFGGILRGLIYPGLTVREGMKIGDLDPRDDDGLSTLVSDKSLAVGGGVLEAICSKIDISEFIR